MNDVLAKSRESFCFIFLSVLPLVVPAFDDDGSFAF